MNRTLSLIIAATACIGYATAQQADMRIDPDLGNESSVFSVAENKKYPFLNNEACAIKLNGADWSSLRAAFAGADSAAVRVLHIGDSHIQAEGATGRTRMRLQEHYGSAGRGLASPLRLAGTNGPADYALRSNTPMKAARLLKTPWTTQPGFTGVGVQPASGQSYDISVSCGEPFDRLRIYTTGGVPDVESTEPDMTAGFISPTEGITDVLLTGETTAVTLKLKGGGSLSAIELLRGNKGVEYSAIGNNGAACSHYNSLPDFASTTGHLRPHLIILSLGTNEAFGRTSSAEMRAQLHTLVSSLRASNPEATFLLTTPQECYRRSYTRRGKRRRRTRTYTINPNIERMRAAIADYGADEGIAVFDWYAASGGAGSAAKWLSNRLMNTDRVHLTWDGYHLMGDILADALIKELKTADTETNHDEDESL